MRVNARFEGKAEQQVMYLAELTGMGVSEVLRTSVQHLYDSMRAQRSGLRHLAAFVGQGDSGQTDVASTYKQRLTESCSHNHTSPAPAHIPPAAALAAPSPFPSDVSTRRR